MGIALVFNRLHRFFKSFIFHLGLQVVGVGGHAKLEAGNHKKAEKHAFDWGEKDHHLPAIITNCK